MTSLYGRPDVPFHQPCRLAHDAMAPHSSTLAWKIPWTEEPSRLQFMGSLRVRHDWATSLSLFTFLPWRRKWQPTPVFLPGESQAGGLPSVGSHRVRHNWSDLAAAAAAGRSNVNFLKYISSLNKLSRWLRCSLKFKNHCLKGNLRYFPPGLLFRYSFAIFVLWFSLIVSNCDLCLSSVSSYLPSEMRNSQLLCFAIIAWTPSFSF